MPPHRYLGDSVDMFNRAEWIRQICLVALPNIHSYFLMSA